MSMVKPGNCWDGVVESIPRLDDDEFNNMLNNILDFPMESLEGIGGVEDWDITKSNDLGPIPSDVIMGPHGKIDIGPSYSFPGPVAIVDGISEQKHLRNYIKEPSNSNYIKQNKFTEIQESTVFQSQSPVSVLESSGSCSSGKILPTKSTIPVKPRSKRAKPTGPSPWLLLSPHLFATNPVSSQKTSNPKKRKNSAFEKVIKYQRAPSDYTEPQTGFSHRPAVAKKCTHCEITKTPQWREGPLGPKTLCNACGVRYRSGRLFPEYRPAASPTFVPSLHSNSHRKVVEMRTKGKQPIVEPPRSPQPEFVPMSSYLFDF